MRSRKTDNNHRYIVECLRKFGVEVIDLASAGNFPDLLVSYQGFGVFLEIKVPGSRSTYTVKQLSFIAKTRWPCAIVTSADEAFRILQNRGPVISQKQKDRLAGFCQTAKASKYHRAAIARVLDVEI